MKKIGIIFFLNITALAVIFIEFMTFSGIKDFLFALYSVSIIYGTYFLCVRTIIDMNETIQKLYSMQKKEVDEDTIE